MRKRQWWLRLRYRSDSNEYRGAYCKDLPPHRELDLSSNCGDSNTMGGKVSPQRHLHSSIIDHNLSVSLSLSHPLFPSIFPSLLLRSGNSNPNVFSLSLANDWRADIPLSTSISTIYITVPYHHTTLSRASTHLLYPKNAA